MGIDKQQRETKQRRMVYDAVMKHFDHPNAEDIYAEVHALDGKISKATVYRNLRLLAENGEIMPVKVPGADRFDSTLTLHYHIICTECGAVEDVPIEYEAEKDSCAESLTGYDIKRHRTVFEGICPKCRKNSQ